MNGYPLVVKPEGSSQMIALGTTGIVCQNSHHPEQVIKAPLKHKLQGCTAEVIKTTLHEEKFAELCFEREKMIYSILPEDPNILHCIHIAGDCIHLPFIRLGNLREYLQQYNQEIGSELREGWIETAVNAISLIHSCDIIHADISTRNFLVADDLSIKLCDFSGSGIGRESPLVEEEDRYRLDSENRSTTTDIFALGCLIFEIMTGLRPYDEIADEDDQDIKNRYSSGNFPCLHGIPYRGIIYKCWTCQYPNVDQLKQDLQNRKKVDQLLLPKLMLHNLAGIPKWAFESTHLLPLLTLTISAVTLSGALIWWHPRSRS